MKLRNKFTTFLLIILLIIINTATAGAAETEGAASGAGTQDTAVPIELADRNIKVDMYHILLEAQDSSSLQVREVIKFNNTQNTAFTGSDKIDENRKAVLKISLPQDYTDLRVEGLSQDSLVMNPDSVVTTTPLNPGITQLTLLYKVPFSNGQVFFSKTLNYDTEILYVLSPKGQLKIKGDQNIVDYGIQNLDGRSYHVLYANKALRGYQFNLTIAPDRVGQGYSETKSGFHSASHLQKWYSSPLASTNPHMWVAGIGLLFFALVAVTGYLLNKKRRERIRQEREERLANMLDDLIIRQKRLLNKIDSLDQKNEQGEIAPEDYADLREQYLAKLVKIKRKIRELEELECS